MPKPIRCIITDDEPLARKGLAGYIEKISFLELAGQCEDAIQLNNLLKQQAVELLFLDIEMPYVSGIEFLKNNPTAPRVIFTTAYERYALQGYELDVLDYLLKPISFDRFLKAANKAHDYLRPPSGQEDYFFIRTDAKLEKINLAEVLFLEAMENYVGIYTRERKFITHSTLKSMQEKLPPASFLQPHKSYIVRLAAIDSVEGNILHVGNYQVPISKYQKEEVLKRILPDGAGRK